MYKYIKNKIKDSSNYILIREQIYDSEALSYDGENFYYYSLHDKGMGIELINNKDNILFFHTNILDENIVNILNEMNDPNKISISPLKIEGIYNFYKNRKPIIKNLQTNNSTWYLIDSYKKLLKKRYQDLKSLNYAYDLEVYLLLGNEQFKIYDNNKTNISFNNSFSSIRHTYKIDINNEKYYRKISISGNDSEILTSNKNINEFEKKLNDHDITNTKLLNNNLSKDLNSKLYDKIIFNYEFIAALIHEIVGHIIEEDNYYEYITTRKFLSYIANLSNNIHFNIYDRPNVNSWGYQPFDCNGNIRGKYKSNSLKLLNTIYSEKWSEKFIFSDRIERYSDFPLPRMSNMTLEMLPEFTFSIKKDTTEFELIDLLIEKKVISNNDDILILIGCLEGYINIKKMEFYVLPEYSFTFKNEKYINIGQKYISFNIINFFDSIRCGFGELINDKYDYCRKKGNKFKFLGEVIIIYFQKILLLIF